VELSGGKDRRCLAALADAYDKTGAHLALDLALQEHDEQLEKTLRSDLERYERDGAIAHPQ
jgi:hypothetical protein